MISSLKVWLCFSFYLISPGEGLIYCCHLRRKLWRGRLLQSFLAQNPPFHIRNICALLAAQDHTHLFRLQEISREAGCLLDLGFKCHKLIGIYEQGAGPLTIFLHLVLRGAQVPLCLLILGICQNALGRRSN